MNNILSNIISVDEVLSLSKNIFNLDKTGINSITNLNVNSIASGIKGIASGVSSPDELIKLADTLKPEIFLAGITDQVNLLKNIDPSKILGNLSENISVEIAEQPGFDINSIIKDLNSKILPAAGIPVITGVSGLSEFPDLLQSFNNLLSAGLTSPLILFNTWLKLIESIADALSDTSILGDIIKESLEDIYSQHIAMLESCIPAASIDKLISLLEDEVNGKTFFDQYSDILIKIETGDFFEIEKLIELVNTSKVIKKAVKHIKLLDTVLDNISSGTTGNIEELINTLSDFTVSNDVILEQFYSGINESLKNIFEGAAGPVKEISNIAGDISAFLEMMADRSEEISETIHYNISGCAKKTFSPIYKLNAIFSDVKNVINDYFQSIELDNVIEEYKKTYLDVSIKIEEFLVKVEILKVQLENAVTQVKININTNLDTTFNKIETGIKDTLANISGILDGETVKTSLEKTKELIDKCKSIIENYSIKNVFDFAVENTDKASGKIESIDMSGTGIPERVALKIGTKVIKSAEIDEIIKDELYTVYKELKVPLEELVGMIDESIGSIEESINVFDPGSIASKYIIDSKPYKLLVKTLEEIKPSVFLKPIEDAYNSVKDNIVKFNPDSIINEIINVNEAVKLLINQVDDNKIAGLISDGFNQITHKFKQVDETLIQGIVDDLKQEISIEKLVSASGITEIAQTEFWQLLNHVFSGAFLNGIEQAVTDFENNLSNNQISFNFTGLFSELQELIVKAENQAVLTNDIMRARLQELKSVLSGHNQRILELQDKRIRLLTIKSGNKELVNILAEIDLSDLINLFTRVDTALTLDDTGLTNSLDAFSSVITGNLDKLKAINLNVLQNTIPAVFKTQFGDPVLQLVSDAGTYLTPYQESLNAINNIITTLDAVPGKIENSFDEIVDSIRTGISQTVEYIISGLESSALAGAELVVVLKKNIQELLDRFDPYLLFNCFTIYDFYGIAGKVQNTPVNNEEITEYGLDIHEELDGLFNSSSETGKQVYIDKLMHKLFMYDSNGNIIRDPDDEYCFVVNESSHKGYFLMVFFKNGDGKLEGNKGSFKVPLKLDGTTEHNDLREKVIRFDNNIAHIVKDLVESKGKLKIRSITIYGFTGRMYTDDSSYCLAKNRITSLKDHFLHTGDDTADYWSEAAGDSQKPFIDFKLASHIENGKMINQIISEKVIGHALWSKYSPGFRIYDKNRRFAAVYIECVSKDIEDKYEITDAKGILSVAIAICSPGSDPAAKLLQSKLIPAELESLKMEIETNVDPEILLSRGSCNNVLKALNAVLTDTCLLSDSNFGYISLKLDRLFNAVNSDIKAKIPMINTYTGEQLKEYSLLLIRRYRINVLIERIEIARKAYNDEALKRNNLIRYNRIYLEADFFDHIRFSVQSLFPLIRQIIEDLYPFAAVKDLDITWEGIVKKVKDVPSKLIKEPLTGEYNKVKDKLLYYFNIDDITAALNDNLSQMDKDVKSGLDNISLAYRRMLDTLDDKLSAQ